MNGKLKNVIIPGWSVQAEFYSPLMSDDTVIYDFKFFSGTSADAVSGFSSGIRELCTSPCIIHAHSLGAMLAIGAIAGLPHLKALVIWSGFAKFARGSDNPCGQDPAAIEVMREQLQANPSGLLKSFYRRMFQPAKLSAGIPGKLNIPALDAGLELLLKCDFRKKLPEITIPVLILHGTEDKIADKELAGVLSKGIKCSSVNLFGNAGHALPFTHWTEAAPVIDEYMRKHDIN